MPPIPPGMRPIFDAFLELSGTRAPAMSGAAPITFSEIAAWQRVHGIRLSPWEIDTLRALDAVALNAATSSTTPGK